MALQPIQSFQGAESPIVSLLQAGNATITGILDRAIQQGAQMSDRRMRQEQDLLAMRQQETALAQRRAEGLTRDITDAQRSARRAYEVDRLFDRDVMEKDRSFERGVTEADRAFKQGRKEFDWRKRITEKNLKRQEDLDVLAKDDRLRRRELETAEEIRRGQVMGLDILKRDEERSRAKTTTATLNDLFERTPTNESEAREQVAALGAYDTASTDQATRAKVRARMARIESEFPESGDTEVEPPSPLDRERNITLEGSIARTYLSDFPEAFPVGKKWMPEEYFKDADGKDIDRPSLENQFRFEVQAVQRAASEDEYAANKTPGVTLTPQQVEARRKFYRAVKRRSEQMEPKDLLTPSAGVPDAVMD